MEFLIAILISLGILAPKDAEIVSQSKIETLYEDAVSQGIHVEESKDAVFDWNDQDDL